MRKLCTTLLIITMFTSCGLHKVDVACKGAKSIAQCCKGIKSTSNKLLPEIFRNEATDNSTGIQAPLPAYSWDSKMMFY